MIDKQLMREELEAHEDRVPHAYQDSKGYWTIGIGHLIDKRLNAGLPDRIIDLLLDYDIDEALESIRQNFHWFEELSDTRQRVIVNLVFNMGISRFKGFVRTIRYIEKGDYDKVPDELRDSKWYREDVGRERSEGLIRAWKDG